MKEIEKKVLLGETSFISVGVVGMLILGAYNYGRISDAIVSNTNAIAQISGETQFIRERVIKRNEITQKQLSEIIRKLSLIEGQLKRNSNEGN